MVAPFIRKHYDYLGGKMRLIVKDISYAMGAPFIRKHYHYFGGKMSS